MRIGDPLDPATQVGALISEEHMDKVLGYIERGRAEGARVLAGGERAHRRRARAGASSSRRRCSTAAATT